MDFNFGGGDFGDDELVTHASNEYKNYDGGYDGGLDISSIQSSAMGYLEKVPGVSQLSFLNQYGASNWMIGLLIVVVFIIAFILFIDSVSGFEGLIEGMGAGNPDELDDGTDGFKTERSDTMKSGFFSGFMNSREVPYFPSVSNHILRKENSEQEAIRKFGKINQERLRREADKSAKDKHLDWDTYYNDWQAQHDEIYNNVL